MIIRLYGHLKAVAGTREIELRLAGRKHLKEVLRELPRELREMVVERGGEPRPGLLIMVNDVDARSVYGYDIYLEDHDSVTIIPMIHGGHN